MTHLERYCKVGSGSFTITGVATRRQGKIRATCQAMVYVQGGFARIVKWREEAVES